ncbi:MAG: ABC transporter permease [Oscillospiraceae bacterium]|nr:ABC transporter permease [Oscillospiraceae bacterium]
MVKYLIKRLLLGALTLLMLATILFLLMHAVPGSPFAGNTGNLPANVREELVSHYALDKPIHIQYIKFLENTVRCDYGISLQRRGRSVSDVILAGFPNTARLGIVAFCIALFVGVLLGTAAAFSKRRWVNRAAVLIAAVGAGVPSFLLAILMMLLFGVTLHWLPVVGLSSWKHYIMPAVSLALAPIAMISRLTKTSLTEVMKQDYMVLAKSKGTDRFTMIVRHAMKNAMTPVVTYAGSLLATLLTGSFVIETLFSVQGIGAEFVASVINADYTMIIALTVLYGAFFVICNTLADIITAVLDPRIKLK